MILTLVRNWSNSEATIGKLYVNGVFACYTLEDEFRVPKIHGETRIPPGVYPIGLHDSPKFSKRYGHKMLHLQNVPGFEFILIHPGNSEKDTQGCLLVGKVVNGTLLGQSRDAYNELYARVSPAATKGDCWIAVCDNDKK